MAETARGSSALREFGAYPGRGSAQDTPAWFTRAISQAPRILNVDRDGRLVRAYRWGDPRGYPVVLLHGAGAGAYWWDHIAPQLAAPGLQVVAVDLAGHGGSDYCQEYTITGWAEDVMAVCSQLSPHQPVLIGHSAGGRVAWTAAEKHSAELRALVTVDGPMPPPAPQPAPRGMFARQRETHHVYAERAEIVRHFRPSPRQASVLPYVLQHIAERSVRQVAGAWTWAYDIGIHERRRAEQMQAGPFGCPVFALVAEHGMRNASGAAEVQREIPQMVASTIPEAGHHVMLDQPLALVGILRFIIGLVGPQAAASASSDLAADFRA
jgi:pimeloyl-ACP methyl ester carboxylesterase